MNPRHSMFDRQFGGLAALLEELLLTLEAKAD
jgi:hypothetical protein